MKEELVVKTNVEELKEYNWISYPIEDGNIAFIDDDNINEASDALKLSPEATLALKDAFQYFAETLIDALVSDLEDVWNVANR